MGEPRVRVRAYRQSDERSWLRCRVLGFLDTCYYDDVWPTRHPYGESTIELVAVDGDPGDGDDDPDRDPDGDPGDDPGGGDGSSGATVVGLLDCAVRDGLATIETIAVHPDHRRRGIATALLDALVPLATERGGLTLDAWTREDPPALAWYSSRGFLETIRYVHVHAVRGDPGTASVLSPDGTVVHAFLHGELEQEDQLRERFGRVYICRRFERPLTA